jgi:hypothetical protein
METQRIGPLHFPERPFLDITQEDWGRLVEALEEVTFAVQRFVRDCRGPGRIVFVSSAVVDFLLSESAQGVTGAVIAADGGFSITKEAGGKPAQASRVQEGGDGDGVHSD